MQAVDPGERISGPEARRGEPNAGFSVRTHRSLWIASVLYSLGCLIAIVAMLADVYTAPPAPSPADTVLVNPEDVSRYLAEYVAPAEPGMPAAVGIPTGVYVTLVEFDGPYTVEISGEVWQRYAADLPAGLNRGIFLPSAKEQPTLTEIYRDSRDNEEIIGWAFHATLREPFDYSRYPMGHHQIQLRMWHPDFERNVYLTPDLRSYLSTEPVALPGLDEDLMLENWDLQQTFFSYRTHRFNTDFGAPTFVENQLHPELYYNIAVRRHLASPLIARGVVPVVTLVTLFIIVMVLSKNEEQSKYYGMAPGRVVFVGAAFLLSTIVAHAALRDEIKPPGLVYLEFYYVLTYLVIVGVVLNSVLLAGRPDSMLFRKHDNFWARLLFWPVTLSVVVIFTVLMFHQQVLWASI